MGYLVQWEDGGAKIIREADTISCRHCQKVLLKKTWREDGGWCFSCGWAVCYPCFVDMQRQGVCLPWKKKIDLAVEAAYKRGMA